MVVSIRTPLSSAPDDVTHLALETLQEMVDAVGFPPQGIFQELIC